MAGKRDLTDKFLKSIKPAPVGKRVIHWDAVVPGFGIRISDKSNRNNVGAFVLVARWPGSTNPAPRTIGYYAVVSPSAADDAAPVGCRMSLARAREIAREWRHDIARGIDPKQKPEEQRHAEEKRRASTFAAAVKTYDEEKLALLSSGPGVHADLERHAVKAWGDRPITDIREDDVEALIKKLKGEVGPGASDKQLSHLKTLFKWAVKKGLIQTSPAANVESLSKKIERDRVLNDTEILAFWRACDKLGGPFAQCFRFLLATGARRSEAGALKWEELDMEARLWTLPRERSKAGQVHTVPLSELAMSIIADRPRLGPFVFSTADGQTAISGWSKAKARVADEMRTIAAERGEEAAAFQQWGLHDLRRTAATNMSKLGVDRLTVSKVLGHAEGGVTKIYDRHSYDREKRRALDLWGQRLESIVAGKTDNVIPLTAARG
jgi:integrase